MNSVIQMLYHLPSFKQVSGRKKREGRGGGRGGGEGEKERRERRREEIKRCDTNVF